MFNKTNYVNNGGIKITQAKVMIILGSGSDYMIAEKTVKVFEQMKVPYDLRVASAHRTHNRIKDIMTNYVDGIEVFIGIAGLSAHLPGVIASYTTKPVIAVPVNGKIEIVSRQTKGELYSKLNNIMNQRQAPSRPEVE